MTLMMTKDSAVLQGAFLSANQLCLPSSLSSIQKADWNRVGCLVLEAIREVSAKEEHKGLSNASAACLKKKLVCALWLKLLSKEAGEDSETAWRENPFFPLQNSIPEVNRVVLLELVKSMAAVDIFASLLLCLPPSQLCTELERLTEHVESSPIREEDAQFLLEVWWELWKSRAGQKDNVEEMFTNQVMHLFSRPGGVSPEATKRLKLDTSDLVGSVPTNDILYILLHSLRKLRDHISTTELCHQALSISLDAIYTSFLIDKEVIHSPAEKIQILSKVVIIREKNNEKLSPELIREVQRDLYASHVPSQFQSCRMNLNEALEIITELAQFWLNSSLLRMEDSSNPSYSVFRSKLSIESLLTALGDVDQENLKAEKRFLSDLLKYLDFSNVRVTPDVNAKITMAIIANCLEDYQKFAVLFASEKSWITFDEHWMDFLEKNQAAFQQRDTLILLASTLVSKFQSESVKLSQCRRIMKVTADIFSALSLEDKNKSLSAMLRISSNGFFGHSVPSAVYDSFEQELNMAFNCIIQGGGGASVAGLQNNLNTAVSLVARVAFQNPEAALRSCCNSAVFNKGAFTLMAKILQQLPGLAGNERQDETQSSEGERQGNQNKDRGREVRGGKGLLCRCVQEIIRTKVLAINEKEQLLKFLGMLMMPVMTVEGDERRESFLSPQEVVIALVLPSLSMIGQLSFDLDLSLQLLHSALCVNLQEQDSSPHWVLHCSPFPLLYILAQLHNQTLRGWETPAEGQVYWSMDTQELLVTVLTTLGQVVATEVASDPNSWSRCLFWLYRKTEHLDWTVRFHLKPVWGEHFKNEVPSSLFAVCDLLEQEWSGLDLPQYGPGTGLLAWTECCCISDSLQSTMLSCLSLDQSCPGHLSMFSKGMLVALTQTLPCCSISQWSRLLRVLRTLIDSDRLYVPFSLEYVDYLPLLDLRRFSCELRLSVLLLRVFQLLCGSSCTHWLSPEGWGHVSRLYTHAVRDMMNLLKAKLPLPSFGALSVTAPSLPKTRQFSGSSTLGKVSTDRLTELEQATQCPLKSEEVNTVPSKEVLFVLSQLFCHVQHVQVMMPEGQCEPLFLCSLEILSHYEAVMAAFPDSSSSLESENTRHFFTTITDNLDDQGMKAVLQQKITQLVSPAN